jgi:MarR family transcriptional regulator, negative regulator of the multidrug operon emrRAB
MDAESETTARRAIETREPRLINVLGAFALALADGIRDATETAARMTGAAPAALVALHQFLAGRTTEDLARATGLTHSGAVRLVDRLVNADLVERRPGRDARSLSIVLTATGRALSHKITEARATAVEAALEGLGSDDRRALLVLVETLIANVTVQRLSAREHGDEPTGWLCRLCDFASCGRPQGQCPAANAAQANATSAPQTTSTTNRQANLHPPSGDSDA